MTFVIDPHVEQITSKVLKEHYRCTPWCSTGNNICCWASFYHTLHESSEPDRNLLQTYHKDFCSIITKTYNILVQKNTLWSREFRSAVQFLEQNKTATHATLQRIIYTNKIFSISLGQTSYNEINKIINNVTHIIRMSKNNNYFVYNSVAFDVEKKNGALAKLHFGDGYSYFFEINCPNHYTLELKFKEFFDFLTKSCILVGHNLSQDIHLCQESLKYANNEPFVFPNFIDTAFLWTRFGGWALDSFGLQMMQSYITGGGMLKKWKLAAFYDWTQPFGKIPLYYNIYNIADLKAIHNLFIAFFIINLPRLFPCLEDFDNSHHNVSVMFYKVVIQACKNQHFNMTKYQRTVIPKEKKLAAELTTPSTFYTQFCSIWDNSLYHPNHSNFKLLHRIACKNQFMKLYQSHHQYI